MDFLLYLCNLHADGPATLRLLRAHGVKSASQLARVPIDRLAEWLGASPAAARRFVREAALAQGATRELELEEGSLLEQLSSEARRPIALDPIALESLAHEELEPWLPSTPSRSAPPASAFARTRLASTPMDEIAPTSPLPSHKIASPRITTAPQWPAPSPHPKTAPALARPTPPNPTTQALTRDSLLRPGLVPGLDARMCEKLIAEGFRTAGQLARLPASRLAPLVGTSSAFLESLCQHAARALEHQSTKAAAAATGDGERIYELRAAPRPEPPRTHWTPEHQDPVRSPAPDSVLSRFKYADTGEDVAGPFAT